MIVLGSAFISACHCNGKRIKGNGNVTTEQRAVTSFDEVDVEGSLDVYVIQGDIKPVRIEGDENLIQFIEVIQEGDKLTIRNKRGYNLRPSQDMKVYLTAPDYKNIDVSGACDIIAESKLNNDSDLSLQVSGAGDIRMELDAPKVRAQVSGSGSVNLKGETKEFELRISGAGNAHCYDLLSENTSVDISGAGDADVYASVKLDAEVSGAGTVRYKGNAKQVNQQVNGAGSVKRVE